MAKITVPIAHYSEEMLGKISELLPNKERNLFIGVYSIPSDSVIARTGKWNYGLKDFFYLKNEKSDKFSIEEMIPEEIKKFEWDAQKLDLGYDIHYTADLSWDTLNEEARFSNLLVIDTTKLSPYDTIKEIGNKLNKCPVLFWFDYGAGKIENFIVPLLTKENVRILSVLSYFLPSMSYTKQVTVLSFLPKGHEEEKNERYLVEMLKSNFHSVAIHWLLTSDFNSELETFMENKNNMFVFDKACNESIELIEKLVYNKRNFIFILC